MSFPALNTTAAFSAVTNGLRRPVRLMKLVQAFCPGGTERQFINLGLALEPSRFVVHFGCLRRFGPLLEEIDARGIPVFDYAADQRGRRYELAQSPSLPDALCVLIPRGPNGTEAPAAVLFHELD